MSAATKAIVLQPTVMMDQVGVPMSTSISDVGYWSGLSATAATIMYVVVQLLQVAGLLRFPLDEILIYGSSLCIVVPFVLLMLAFHYLTEGDKRYWTHAALIFSVVYAVFVTANYVVQLATVIPARLNGEGEAVRLLEQTPHSLFWDYDAIGYIAMGLATLVAIPALDTVGLEKWVRRSFIAHAPCHAADQHRVLLPDLLAAATLPRFPVGHHGTTLHVDAGDPVAEARRGARCLARRVLLDGTCGSRQFATLWRMAPKSWSRIEGGLRSRLATFNGRCLIIRCSASTGTANPTTTLAVAGTCQGQKS
jgi:hypothetical protein